MAKMKSNDFVRKLTNIAKNHNTVYMKGVFGSPVTERIIAQKAKQYPDWYTATRQKKFRALIGKNYFGFDCVCLIKAVMWGWVGDAGEPYGGASYASNGVPDIGEDQMMKQCKGVSTNFKNLAIGEALGMAGHIGVYIGNGLAIECTAAWDSKVMITAVGNIGAKAGYKTRAWLSHGQLSFIDYKNEPIKPVEPVKPPASAFKVGDTVSVNKGARSYTGVKVASFVYDGKYQLDELVGNRAVIGKGSICTAFKVNDLTLVKAGSTSTPIKAGDRIKIKNSAQKYSTGQKIPAEYKNKAYHVQQVATGKEVLIKELYSWVNVADVDRV